MMLTYVLSRKKGDIYRGYFLSVDEEGIPSDYKFTEDVRLSRFQKYIFGVTLEKYIKNRVFLEKFLKTVEFNIDFMFFEDEVFLENSSFENCAFISDSDEKPLGETGDYQLQTDGSYLIQHSFSGNPAKVRVRDEKIIQRLSEIIKTLGKNTHSHNFTILEPMERLKKVSEE